MLPLPRLAPHLPRTFDPLYNRVQLLYNRHNSQQNPSNFRQQPLLLRSNRAFSDRSSAGGGQPFCTVSNFSHQVASNCNAEGENGLLNLEQYYDQVKCKLQNNEINFQRPVNNLKFVEYENLFAYNVLKESAEYERTVGAVLAKSSSNSGQVWPANLPEAIFESQLNSSQGSYIESIKEQINAMSATEVISFQRYLLGVIPFCAGERDWERIFYQSAFCTVWQTLDLATVNLLANFEQYGPSSQEDLYQLLAISGLWFEMGLAKEVTFNRALLQRLLTSSTFKNEQKSKVSLMHLTFALNLSRSVEPSQVSSLVSAVSSYLDQEESSAQLSLDELSVIAMGFFKTKTKMPCHLLSRFVALCSNQFAGPEDGSPVAPQARPAFTSTIAVASVLKLIRFSLETTEFDARSLRDPIRSLVDRICAHDGGVLLDSNICLTHLILLLNSAYLQNARRLYKTIFERMMASLDGFRIKDIERVLFCLANVYFVCPNYKLKALEDYLMASEESQLYPYHVYNITYYLLVLDFFPHRLVDLCADGDFLSKAIDSFKQTLNDTLLITDTILRLETAGKSAPYQRRILTDEQHEEYHREQMAHSGRNIPPTTKRARFLRATRDILAGPYADRLRLMYLFPFAKYPFPVLLTPEAARHIPQTEPTDNILKDALPYRLDQLVDSRGRDGLSFAGSTAILVLVNKDKTYGSNLRGFTLVNKRLLERMGFRVLLLEQRDYPDMVLPRHLFSPTSPRYLSSVETLLKGVAELESKVAGRQQWQQRGQPSRRSDDQGDRRGRG